MKYIKKIKEYILDKLYDSNFWFYTVGTGIIVLWYLCYLYNNLSM